MELEQEQNQQKQAENWKFDKENFTDEVKIGDETIFTISKDRNVMQLEKESNVRVSRWGEKPERKKQQNQNAVLDMAELIQRSSNAINFTADVKKKEAPSPQPEVKQKKTKWGPEFEKTFLPPLLQFIPYQLTQDDAEYVIRLIRLDELSQKVEHETIHDDIDCRSPSPDPTYDSNGIRINTRLQRRKEKNIKERHNIIEECIKIKSSFVAPSDYKPNKKIQKITLPEQSADINWIGKIIGPKGQTQKKLEQQTGCSISIRGKGSSRTNRIDTDKDEPLHVLIQASTDEQLKKGIEEIQKIVSADQEDISKNNQQLSLQIVQNILLSEICEKCHERGHKGWECQNKQAFNKPVIRCDICGEYSHVTIDCPQKSQMRNAPGQYSKFKAQQNMRQSHDFAKFMAEAEGDKGGQMMGNTRSGNNPQAKELEQFKQVRTSFITDDITQQLLYLTQNGQNADNQQSQPPNRTEILDPKKPVPTDKPQGIILNPLSQTERK